MENLEILRLIKLNTSFYIKHQEEFSKTRKNYWNGWYKIADTINKKFDKYESINVLDIGCGNARFYNFLSKNILPKINYTGVDNNDYFLIEAILKYKHAKFKKIDVVREIDKIDQKFDIVAVFGLTHHLPGSGFRLEWLEKVSKLVSLNGILAISFWDLLSDKRSGKLVQVEGLEENDYYYGWNNSNDFRYVHLYDENELSKIKFMMEKNNFKIKENYKDDGKNSRMNKYIIFSL